MKILVGFWVVAGLGFTAGYVYVQSSFEHPQLDHNLSWLVMIYGGILCLVHLLAAIGAREQKVVRELVEEEDLLDAPQKTEETSKGATVWFNLIFALLAGLFAFNGWIMNNVKGIAIFLLIYIGVYLFFALVGLYYSRKMYR